MRGNGAVIRIPLFPAIVSPLDPDIDGGFDGGPRDGCRASPIAPEHVTQGGLEAAEAPFDRRRTCPSCTARRMSDEAAYLVDMVLPEAPYRQWTLTFPFEVRFLMARDHRLITAIPWE
jgi:hypothetical protein